MAYLKCMSLFTEVKDSLLHLVFPHVCEGCGSDLLEQQHMICLRCLSSLPQTNYHLHPNNPIEKMFWGRIPLVMASSQFYFTRGSVIQQLMHQLKYRGNKELGIYLGSMMGHAFISTNRFSSFDGLIPLPLYSLKEKKRGYNQATVLCEGISKVTGWPVYKNIVGRTDHTESQTKKGRVERWANMEGRFILLDETKLKDRKVLLVDDVITTGATLEACGRALLQVPGLQLSIATLCFSSGN
jgi:ComF family protein